ncbi:MAG: sel1 repeat family protein [Deltaproteobacteria bacterium]|jgi:TPR repeat protein|nr:sel1 repeat family protein [Deltaproteobacteria bacterium]
MHAKKEVLILLPLSVLAAAAGAAPAAAGMAAAAMFLALSGAGAARADYWEITPEQYYEKALAFRDGDKVEKDPKQAYDAFLSAARKGHVGAMSALGEAHYTARGAEMDKHEALSWFLKAAEKDDPLSVYRLADYHRKGYGMPEDAAKATECLKKASGLGCSRAQLELSVLTREGADGVGKDPAAAFGLLLKAADQGLPEAMEALAKAYENGEGTDKDLEKAGAVRRKLDELKPKP